jgi:transcriptional regulator GlxA family with amidase domain
LFVQALRAWCNSDGAGIGWLAALRDPQLAAAMHALHSDLSRSWTVAGLAKEAGLSRSTFAAAFKARTGQAPLDYLTSWRMYRAKTYLRDSQLSLLEIAVRVGYDTDTALSRAFRRREGVAPGTWRKSVGRPSSARALSGIALDRGAGRGAHAG